MATKHTDACLQKAADDEPIFVLRAKDRTAPACVRGWVDVAVMAGMDPDSRKAHEALALADEMEAWAAMYGSKVPD